MNITTFKSEPVAEEQLKDVQIELNGYTLRWEELDEDLTVSGIVAGHNNCRF
jgi:hypothetical protein